MHISLDVLYRDTLKLGLNGTLEVTNTPTGSFRLVARSIKTVLYVSVLVIALEFSNSGKLPSSIAFRISWISELPTRTHSYLNFLQNKLNFELLRPEGDKFFLKSDYKMDHD